MRRASEKGSELVDRSILIVANFDLARSYGSMQRTRRVALGLARRGWDVVVSTEDSKSPIRAANWAGALIVDTIRTEIDYDDFTVVGPGSIRAMAQKEQSKAVAIQKLEDAHEFGWTWLPFPSHELVAAVLGRWRQYATLHEADAPVVVDVQGLEASLFRFPLARWASLLAEIREVSSCEGAVFVDQYPYDVLSDFVAGPTALIPNGIDISQFRPRSGVEARYLTFVGRLARERGIWTFLRAVRLLSGEALSFRVVGNGPAFPAAVNYCRRHGLPVSFLGNVPHENMPRVYRESLAVINPIHIDGISQISLEAMACGAVLVKSENKVSDEVFEDMKTAVLFPRGHVQALAEAMELIALDEEARQRISEQGRQMVRERYSQDREIERIESFLIEVEAAA